MEPTTPTQLPLLILSREEEEVIKYLCQGKRWKEISCIMKFSRQTLYGTFLKPLLRKFGAHSTAQICAIYASQHPDIFKG